MVVTVKIDLKCAALYAGCLVVCFLVLLIAFPKLSELFPKNSSDLASWIQAIGSIAAIFFAARLAARQMAHTEEHQRSIKAEESSQGVLACLIAARDAHEALANLAQKLAITNDRPPSSSLERIESIEKTIRVLLSAQPHPRAVHELLIILMELAYSRVAIREYSAKTNRDYQARTSVVRAKKVKAAENNLSRLYKNEKAFGSKRIAG